MERNKRPATDEPEEQPGASQTPKKRLKMNSKTPIMILQEYMMKKNCTPEYEFLGAQTHDGQFQCSVKAESIRETGTGRTKKEAKQNAAILVLDKLQSHGLYYPSETANTNIKEKTQENEVSTSNVAKLRDLCMEYHMPDPDFDLLSETGPPHSRMFTVECKTGSVIRLAVASTKKIARQKAAGLVLDYFKENVPKRIADIEEVNASALVQLNDAAKSKYVELNSELPQRPNLGQIISDYHFGFVNSIEKTKVKVLEDLLQNYDNTTSCIIFIEEFFKTIPLEFEWSELPSNGAPISTFSASRANPPIFIACLGKNEFDAKEKCAVNVLDYVSLMISLK